MEPSPKLLEKLDEIERAFDLGEQLRHVDDVFDRVFQEVAV